MSERDPRRARVRIDPSDLALEIISIVIAIILATAAGQWLEHYRASQRTSEALMQIRLEIAHDDDELRRLRPLHRRVQDAFSAAVGSARGERLTFDTLTHTFGDAAPQGFNPFRGTTTAWELARGSDALSDVPYTLRAKLQKRYAELAVLNGLNVALLEHLEATPSEDRPNFYFTAQTVRLVLVDIVDSEDRVIVDDGDALAALSAAGVR